MYVKGARKRHGQRSLAVLQSPATAEAAGYRGSVVLHMQFCAMSRLTRVHHRCYSSISKAAKIWKLKMGSGP